MSEAGIAPGPSAHAAARARARAWIAARAEPLASIAAALLIAALQWFPAFRDPAATGFGDWQMIHHNWEAAYVALARFGEWPLWDPFHCGGVSILGNPESQLYAPLFWLSFALGTVLALKLFLLLHVAAALLGAYWLARAEYRLQPIAAALAGVAWGLCGCIVWDGAGGHATFLPFAFAPWLVLCFRRSERSRACAVATAGILALTLLEGGTYPFPYFLLLLGFELARKLIVTRPRRVLLRSTATIMVLTLLLGAIRLIPIAIALHDTPRTIESRDFLGFADVVAMLTAPSHAWRFPPHPYVWAEYGSYVGWPVVGFALAGLVLCARRGPRDLLAGAALFLLLMLGSRAPYYPWPLLHELPVFDSLRVPSRFAILFTLYVALLAAVALDCLLRKARARLWRVVAGTLVAAQAVHMIAVHHPIVDSWHGPPISTAAPAAQFHLVRDHDYDARYASYPHDNLGTDVCYIGGMSWPVSPALWIGARPQARVPATLGRVLSAGRTSRRVFADVDLSANARVIFNQNYARGFVSSVGSVVEDRGRLAVDAPAGTQRIEVTYTPEWFLPSAGLSLAGLALSLLHLRVLRRTRQA